MKRLYADIHKKIDGFDLNVMIESDAARIGILGESGSGKSMTLRSIAGIETVDSGHIEVDGRVLFDSASQTDLKPQFDLGSDLRDVRVETLDLTCDVKPLLYHAPGGVVVVIAVTGTGQGSESRFLFVGVEDGIPVIS